MKVFPLVGALIVLCLSTTLNQSDDWRLSRSLTLKFDYAARYLQPLHASKFLVQWNQETVLTVTPKDHSIHRLSLRLRGDIGWNQIKFIGAGNSDSIGAGITNVRLQRPGGCQQGIEDLIENGNFCEGHDLGKGWKIFKKALGSWQGKDLEIGYGANYNRRWKGDIYVCQLYSNGNQGPHQWIYLDQFYRWVDPEEEAIKRRSKLHLKFNYAARQNKPFTNSLFQVYWNDQEVDLIYPDNYRINSASYTVYAKQGDNYLKFIGLDGKDGYGVTISNVALMNGKKNLIKNGRFQHPKLQHCWKIYQSIPGWTGTEIEVGWGRFYNRKWGSKIYVIQLDSDKIVQRLRFDRQLRLI